MTEFFYPNGVVVHSKHNIYPTSLFKLRKSCCWKFEKKKSFQSEKGYTFNNSATKFDFKNVFTVQLTGLKSFSRLYCHKNDGQCHINVIIGSFYKSNLLRIFAILYLNIYRSM